MPKLLRAALAAALPVVFLLAAAGSAAALTVRDVIELARAGLGEETLLALVEIEPAAIAVAGDDLRAMKAAGVTEAVMIAMLRHGRTQPLPSEVREQREFSRELARRAVEPPPPPQVIVIEARETRREPEVVQVPVFVPIAVPVRTIDRRDDPDRDRGEPKTPELIFWGWGGKQRPDSWKLPEPPRRP